MLLLLLMELGVAIYLYIEKDKVSNEFKKNFPQCWIKLDEELKYSRTSQERPPKMSSQGGCVQKLVAYESLDHIGSKGLDSSRHKDILRNRTTLFKYMFRQKLLSSSV